MYLFRSLSSLFSHLGMGASPTPAHSAHCLRRQNKSSLKVSRKHLPNPQPRLHEVSNCGLWVITLQLGFSADVRGRLVTGQLSLLAKSMYRMQDQGSPALLLILIQPTLCPLVPSFLSSTALLACSPFLSLRLTGTWVINSSIKTIKKEMNGRWYFQALYYRPSGRLSWCCASGLSLYYLKISPLSYFMICT